MIRKLIRVVSVFSLLAIGICFASGEPERDKSYELNPYEIGVDKKVGTTDFLLLKYKNEFITKKETKISGVVEVHPSYIVETLSVDYYLMNENQSATRVIPLLLKKGSIPNTFVFNITYKTNWDIADYELMVIEIVTEEVDTQSI